MPNPAALATVAQLRALQAITALPSATMCYIGFVSDRAGVDHTAAVPVPDYETSTREKCVLKM